MAGGGTHVLVARLSSAGERDAALRALADHVGATELFLFVPDPELAKWVPAPGCHARVASSRGWRQLLAVLSQPGIHTAEVSFPDAASTQPAVAYAYVGVAFVAVGQAAPRLDLVDELAVTAPLLANLLRAEADAQIARGELQIAKQAAERASTLATALDHARGVAERAVRVKDEFLAMLGHELRNPLAPIVSALHILRQENGDSRTRDILERQVGHLQRLVDDLLDVSRITSGKIELRRELVSIAAVVQRATELSRPLLEQERSQLVVRVPDDPLVVDGDPARLAQILSNLLTNAAKYSDPGTRVSLIAERAGTNVRITVEDQGIGIDPEFLDRIFDNFVQVPQGLDRSLGGLGLGLAIVRNLVQLHGGSVRASSEGRGAGSRFIVDLPACEVAPAAPEEEAPSPAPSAQTRVLVVDDNVDAADLLGDALAGYGHEVRVVHSGEDALSVMSEFSPQVCIFDIGLPGMDGYALARAVRARGAKLPLVALTGYGQPSDRARTREAGFDAHLTKPVKVNEVTRLIDELLLGGMPGMAVGTA